MPWFPTRVLAPALVLAAAASSLVLVAHAPEVRAQCGAASGSPCPTPPPPTPVNAFLSLDVTQGDANTVINVSGGQFLPNEQLSLYWDTPDKVAGSATADGAGSFNARVKAFANDAPGQHKLCASVAPNPCAFFTLQATQASPSPSPTPSASPSASPTVIATQTANPSPVAATLNGFDVITRPPFLFLPLAGVIAIALALGFWLYSVARRPRPLALTSAAVVHRATRPDYSAGFGSSTATALPAPASLDVPPEPPAENAPPEPPAENAPPAQAPSEANDVAQTEWGPPVEWGTGSSDWGFAEPPPSDDAADAADPRD